MLLPQLDCITDELNAREYVRYCLREGFSEDVRNAQYPHPYILLWLEAVRHGDSTNGVTAYPEPQKGYMEQDADLMLAFSVCDEFREDQQKNQERREQVSDLARKQGW